MLHAQEGHHLKGKWLLSEVVRLTKGNMELDTPKGHGFLGPGQL